MSNHFVNRLLGAALILAGGTTFAQSKAPTGDKPAAPGVKELGMENAHAMCIGCHGIPGYKTAFPSTYHVPKIAGQQPGYNPAGMQGVQDRMTSEHLEQMYDAPPAGPIQTGRVTYDDRMLERP